MIFAVLDKVVEEPAMIRDLDTPQGLATKWIIDQDAMQLCPDDPKIIQRWALAVMYFSTDGDEWDFCFDGDDLCPQTEELGVFLNNFLSPVDECDWFGITCGAVNATDGRRCVERIIFENNDLSGTIPTELALLPDLKVLGMEQGTTSGTIPSELGQLKKMIFIDLDFNELTGTIPSEIYQLTNLITLDLNVNFLNGTLDSRIGNLTNLEFVQLQKNSFTGTIPTEVGMLSSLETFNVHRNDFNGAMPRGVCDLRKNSLLSSLIADCKCKGGNPKKVRCNKGCCTGCGCPEKEN